MAALSPCNYLTKSNNYSTVPLVARPAADVAAAERALERLFRLTMNRKVHTRQTAAVGADVTRAGYAVLRCIDEAGERTLSDVARECSMDAAAASRQVKALEDDGFIGRRANPDDGRVAVLRLTPAGRAVYRRIVSVREAYMDEVLAGWSAADRATLTRLVDRLVDDLSNVPFGRAPRRRTA
jgi:DNA-binding MarR family transcriptional regulator